jgi:hypothetical protein
MVGHPGQVNPDDCDRLLATRARVALLLCERKHPDVYRRWLLGFAHALNQLILAGEPLSTRNRASLWRIGARLERHDHSAGPAQQASA